MQSMRSMSTSCGMVMRSSASLASSPLSIVTTVQRRPTSLRAIAVNTCVPIGLWGLIKHNLIKSDTRENLLGNRLMLIAPKTRRSAA